MWTILNHNHAKFSKEELMITQNYGKQKGQMMIMLEDG